MPGVTVDIILRDVRKVEADALVVGFFEDVRPLKGLAGQLDWLLCGSLSRLLIENRLRGSLGDVALLTARGKVPAPKIFLVGFGPRSAFSVAALRTAAGTAAASAAGAGVGRVAMEYFSLPGVADDDFVPAFREGLAEGAGGRSLAVSLIAPDAAAYEKLSRIVKA